MVYPTDIFEAVMWKRTVRVSCACGNIGLFHPNGLWWISYRRSWLYTFRDAITRFYCEPCLRRTYTKVRPKNIDTTTEWPCITLPMPPEREWARMLKSMR